MRLLRTLLRIQPLRALLKNACSANAGTDSKFKSKSNSSLAVHVLGRDWPSPLGLAAGFDKNAEFFSDLEALGFGHIEVGTLTPQPQPGNERPRLFRLPRDQAIINRMGFNNCGIAEARARLALPRDVILGVNLGKNKVTEETNAASDYAEGARTLASVADYLVINVSSPNTPGLRDLQTVAHLMTIVNAVQMAVRNLALGRRVPLLVKIAPDLADEDVDAIVDFAISEGLDGLIVTNTSISRAGLRTEADRVAACGSGGLSGAPLRARAIEVLERAYHRASGKLVFIASGGIMNPEDVWDRLVAGASLVQTYTGFIYGGPFFCKQVYRWLQARCADFGESSLQSAIERARALKSAERDECDLRAGPEESMHAAK